MPSCLCEYKALSQISRLERVYRRKIPTEYLITPELAGELAEISFEVRRQTGVLVNRQGKITHVIIGEPDKIIIPDTSDYKIAGGRLKGLRCIHTHLKQEQLSNDDLTDLALLRLDMMAAITIAENGRVHKVYAAHILPDVVESPYRILPPIALNKLDINCDQLIQSIEDELTRGGSVQKTGKKGVERALLASVSTLPKNNIKNFLVELKELCTSSNIEVVGIEYQQRKKVDPKFLMGVGKLNELTILAMQKGATLLVFDQELNPAQIRNITDRIEIKVIDRTQLILDIFAQRAQTREGKLQVELAQLNYLLPRLAAKNTAMSRLTGGIGGRGPGETKLEINKRRVRDKINKLKKSLSNVKKHRRQQRAKRNRNNVPVISIVGYTNAGKSTLLNTLTQSNILTENKLFATLDPSSRRLRFPKDMEVIITDTVGFIRDLPKELMAAFQATLEELESADLLLHVVDISNKDFKKQIDSVNTILFDLNLNNIPMIYVLNKADVADKNILKNFKAKGESVTISANNRKTLQPLIEIMEQMVSEK